VDVSILRGTTRVGLAPSVRLSAVAINKIDYQQQKHVTRNTGALLRSGQDACKLQTTNKSETLGASHTFFCFMRMIHLIRKNRPAVLLSMIETAFVRS
jgi:hypothetical protein